MLWDRHEFVLTTFADNVCRVMGLDVLVAISHFR